MRRVRLTRLLAYDIAANIASLLLLAAVYLWIHRSVAAGVLAGMDVPDRIGELLLRILPRKAVEELLVVVDGARDDVEMQPLRRLRLAVHEQRQ